MTHLETRKTRLVFTTSADAVREAGRFRGVVVEAHRGYANVRLAGMRKSFPISYAAIYSAAVKISVEKQRAEKRAAKKTRR